MQQDYQDWPREKMIEHLDAYSSAIHELAGNVMQQKYEIFKLKQRLQFIAATRSAIYGA